MDRINNHVDRIKKLPHGILPMEKLILVDKKANIRNNGIPHPVLNTKRERDTNN